jgi:hypothetical protein
MELEHRHPVQLEGWVRHEDGSRPVKKSKKFTAQYEHTVQIMYKFNIIDNSVLAKEKSCDFYCEINGYFRCEFNC